MEAYHHQPQFESFAHPGTRIYERKCDVDAYTKIRVLHFHPPENTGKLPIVMVPGLSSVLESFRGLLQEITRTHVVIYVETREKSSSTIGRQCRFDMPAFAKDLEVAIARAGLNDKGYLLAGYSLGAAVIVEAYSRLRVKPAQIVLAEPVPKFRIPIWSLPLALWAPWIFPVLKPFAKWYMRHFMIDSKKDPEIMRIVERALDGADPYKLGKTLRSLYLFDAWNRLPALDMPTLIVSASADTLHRHEDIVRMKKLIPGSSLVDLVDNKRTHSREMALFLKELS